MSESKSTSIWIKLFGCGKVERNNSTIYPEEFKPTTIPVSISASAIVPTASTNLLVPVSSQFLLLSPTDGKVAADKVNLKVGENIDKPSNRNSRSLELEQAFLLQTTLAEAVFKLCVEYVRHSESLCVTDQFFIPESALVKVWPKCVCNTAFICTRCGDFYNCSQKKSWKSTHRYRPFHNPQFSICGNCRPESDATTTITKPSRTKHPHSWHCIKDNKIAIYPLSLVHFFVSLFQ